MTDTRYPFSTTKGTVPTADDRRGGGTAVPSELRPDAQLGKYRVIRHLGKGGMGTVYEAVHVEIGKPVALKVLAASLASDPRAHARFLREAANLSRLAHPHVVNVIDFGTDAESPYLVMELLRGEDLAHHLYRRGGGLSAEQAVEVLLPICSGIIAAHQAGIIHRDIKPTNVFLAQTALNEIEPKVLDFGIAKTDGESADVSQTQGGALVGTPQYMSPEQVKGGSADARSDQYAVGVVLYECLAGRNPYEGSTQFQVMRNIAAGEFLRLSAIRPDVFPELERVVMRAMSSDPRARFASVFDFGRALLPFAAPLPRAIWTRYFEADGPSPSIPAPAMHGPAQPKTSILPATGSAAAPVRGSLTDSSWYVNSSTANAMVGDVSTFRTRRPSSGRRVLAGGALVLVAAAVFAIGRSRWNETDAEAPTSPSPTRTGPRAPLPSDESVVTIDVSGLPPGAAVLLDGAPQQLPLRIPRGRDARDLLVRAPGYQPTTRRIVPFEDQMLSIPLQPLAAPEEPRQVTINLASEPPGAEVRADGDPEPKGRTPIALAVDRSSRPRRFTLRLAGHRERTLVVVPDADRAPDVVRLLRLPAANPEKRSPVRKPTSPRAEDGSRPRFTKMPD